MIDIQSWPNNSGHPNNLLYIINKSFFTQLSITMKWINLWMKKFRRLYLHEITFNLIQQQLFLHKSKTYQGVKKKKHDFEISM